MILDTNVVSALMNAAKNPPVVAWLDGVNIDTLALTAITVFEIRLGIERLPQDRRRQQLEVNYLNVMAMLTPDQILPFDHRAAEIAGRIDARRRNEGREVGTNDAQIAAIAISRGLPIITRNGRHFADVPVSIIDPWAQPA